MNLKPNAFLHNQILKAPGYDQHQRPVLVDVVFDRYLDKKEVIKGRIKSESVTLDCIIIANGDRVKATTALLTSTPV